MSAEERVSPEGALTELDPSGALLIGLESCDTPVSSLRSWATPSLVPLGCVSPWSSTYIGSAGLTVVVPVVPVGPTDLSSISDSPGEGMVVPVTTGAIFCGAPVLLSMVSVCVTAAAPAEPSANTQRVTTPVSTSVREINRGTAFR